MSRVVYTPLCETGVFPISKNCGQNRRSITNEETASERTRRERKIQRKLSNHESFCKTKKHDGEKEILKRENEWLRKRLSAANIKLRDLNNREDRMSTGGNNANVSCSRSSRMRCSVLGRKKNKESKRGKIKSPSGRCSPTDATVVTGSLTKSKSKKDSLIRHNTEDKLFSQNYFRRNLSPRPSRTLAEEITPPCTPERSPTKNNWSTRSNCNRHLDSPPWSGTLKQQQDDALILQPHLLGIEACLPKSKNKMRRQRHDMFLSFRSAVSAEILSVEESNCLHEI